MVVETTFGNLDVLVRLTAHNYHVVVSAVVIADQVAGADLLLTWIVYSPPWKIAKHGVRTQRGPAEAVGSPVVEPATGGAVGRGVHCPGGIDFPELRQGGLHTFFRRVRRYGRDFFLVGLGAVDMDAVGGGVIGHTEVYRSADVSEPDVVVSADAVGGHVHPLSIHVDGLGTQCGGDAGGRLGGGAAHCKTGEDAEPHKDCFPFPVHNLIPFQFCCAFRKHNHAEGGPGSQEQLGRQHGEKQRYK